MSKSKHSGAQIIAALKQLEGMRTAEDVPREWRADMELLSASTINVRFSTCSFDRYLASSLGVICSFWWARLTTWGGTSSRAKTA